MALETTDTVMAERLPDLLAAGPANAPAESIALGNGFSLDEHLNGIEKDLVVAALDKAEGDRGRACELLGVTPRSLRYLIRKHGLPAGR